MANITSENTVPVRVRKAFREIDEGLWLIFGCGSPECIDIFCDKGSKTVYAHLIDITDDADERRALINATYAALERRGYTKRRAAKQWREENTYDFCATVYFASEPRDGYE